MKLEELAKEHDFKTETDYYNYIVESLVNGQRQQVKDLFNEMEPDDQREFLNSYLEDNRDLWRTELINEIRIVCINELIN